MRDSQILANLEMDGPNQPAYNTVTLSPLGPNGEAGRIFQYKV